MSKNLEELKKENISNITDIKIIMYHLMPILEDFEKRLKKAEAELGIYTEEEIKNIKVGGTDPN